MKCCCCLCPREGAPLSERLQWTADILGGDFFERAPPSTCTTSCSEAWHCPWYEAPAVMVLTDATTLTACSCSQGEILLQYSSVSNTLTPHDAHVPPSSIVLLMYCAPKRIGYRYILQHVLKFLAQWASWLQDSASDGTILPSHQAINGHFAENNRRENTATHSPILSGKAAPDGHTVCHSHITKCTQHDLLYSTGCSTQHDNGIFYNPEG